jgi:eukaryotic-like serine/threonine-protein kinase
MMDDRPNPALARPRTLERIGRYRIVERLGKGAMGVVYAASDDLMDREVAIKVLMNDLEGEPDMRARFMREAQVAARLAHPNIVTVLDIGEDDGRLFIVMERLRGLTLSECLKQRQLTLEEKTAIMIQVCDGLAAAAAAGVCHRDVKPGNLFLEDDGGVKILDFGIARMTSSNMTSAGMIIGTPDFMSPEQARGEQTDERSDIFSAGAVWYLLLTGRKPFAASELRGVLDKVVSEDPLPLQPFEAPPSLARLVHRALAKKPDERHQRFEDLAAHARRFERRYEAETSALAVSVHEKLEEVRRLFAEADRLAAALELEPFTDLARWLRDLVAIHPVLEAKGIDAIRVAPLHRSTVEEAGARVEARRIALGETCAELGACERRLTEASAATTRNPSFALSTFRELEEQLRNLGYEDSPVIARQLQAAEHAVSQRLENQRRAEELRAEASSCQERGQLERALERAREADRLDAPAGVSPQTRSLEDLVARDTAERRRAAERGLGRARELLAAESFDEAALEVGRAKQRDQNLTGTDVLSAQIAAARSAHATTITILTETAAAIVSARSEHAAGRFDAAAAELRSILERYPGAPDAQAELTRLDAERRQREVREQQRHAAVQSATDAETAWERHEIDRALAAATSSLAADDTNEQAIRIAIAAKAAQREAVEKAVRTSRATACLTRARAFLTEQRFDKAMREAEQAAGLDALNPAVSALLAAIAASRRDDTDARRVQEQRDARLRVARTAVADARKARAAGQLDRARRLADEALAADADSVEARQVAASIAAASAIAAATSESGAAPDTAGRSTGLDSWISRAAQRVQGAVSSLADRVGSRPTKPSAPAAGPAKGTGR